MPRWSAAAPPGSTTATTTTRSCRHWKPRPAPPAVASGHCRKRSGCRPGNGAAAPRRTARPSRRRAGVARARLVLQPGQALDHLPDRAELDAVLEQVTLVIGVAPPVPAAVGVDVADIEDAGQVEGGGADRPRLRIEHDDPVGVGPLVDADVPVEPVAQRLFGLLAAMQHHMQPARAAPVAAQAAGT